MAYTNMNTDEKNDNALGILPRLHPYAKCIIKDAIQLAGYDGEDLTSHELDAMLHRSMNRRTLEAACPPL
jgi:preprotein translocase subunit SecB